MSLLGVDDISSSARSPLVSLLGVDDIRSAIGVGTGVH